MEDKIIAHFNMLRIIEPKSECVCDISHPKIEKLNESNHSLGSIIVKCSIAFLVEI